MKKDRLCPLTTSVYLTPTPTYQTVLAHFPPAHSLIPPQTDRETESQLMSMGIWVYVSASAGPSQRRGGGLRADEAVLFSSYVIFSV